MDDSRFCQEHKNCWLSRCPQITAIVVGSGTPFYRAIGGSAISPLHVINCQHAACTTGEQLLFVDRNNSNVVRTVVASTNDPSNDINVALLNTNLPATITYFSVLPANATNYLPTLTSLCGPELQVIGCDQYKELFPKLWVSGWGPFSTAIDSSLWLGTNWNVPIVSGDSGHPITMLVGTNLILLSHWTVPNGGFNYAYYESEINSMMHYLSTNNNLTSDYQLTTNSLTAWPSY